MAYTTVTASASAPQIIATVAAPVTAITAGTLATRSLTIGGSTPDMIFYVNWPLLDTGLVIAGVWCDTAGTVKLRLYNPTGGDITPGAQTLKVIGF